MILLPFKENIKKLLKCDNEEIKVISKIYNPNLDRYKNDKKIIYRYYASYLKNSKILRKFNIFDKIKEKFSIEDTDESYENLFTNINILHSIIFDVVTLLYRREIFRIIDCYMSDRGYEIMMKKKQIKKLRRILNKSYNYKQESVSEQLLKFFRLIKKPIKEKAEKAEKAEKENLFENNKYKYLNCFDEIEKK